MVYKFFDEKLGSGISVNEELTAELHKPVINNFKRRKVYATFKDNISAADLAEMRSLSSMNKNVTGYPTKMSLFFFGNNFYKNKETFKIFSPQILEVYRILLVETTLELTMFYYTFSVINTMFIPCTVLLYEQQLEQ